MNNSNQNGQSNNSRDISNGVSLAERSCAPIEKGTVPLFREKAEELLKEVPDWTLSPDGKSISKEILLKNFLEAMHFANNVAQLAEMENHHPDMAISWGKVGMRLSTHSVGGLSENDLILAAKIDQLRA